jgi:O-antigen/teichoic acid export membrane protein
MPGSLPDPPSEPTAVLEDVATARPLTVKGQTIAKNTALNIVGRALPLLVGVVAVPVVLKSLGAERFGLLSLAWTIVAYFTTFDFGLDRATTKFVAEALGRGEPERVPSIVWAAVITQSCIGLFAGTLLALATPLLVDHFLRISPHLVSQARLILFLLAAVVPVMIVTDSFQGVLEASQRFGIIQLLRVPNSLSTYLVPMVGALFGWSLATIVLSIVMCRVAVLAGYFCACASLYPGMRRITLPKWVILRPLVAFGGWIAIASSIYPVLTYLDRILIGGFVGVEKLAFYVVPADLVSRLGVFPTSAGETLFPAFSTALVSDRGRIPQLFRRGVKFMLLIVGPFAAVVFLWAPDILRLWVGDTYAARGAGVARILACGLLINSLAWVPVAMLEASGRADLVAKAEMICFPFYVGLTYLLTRTFGITGAAFAVAIRLSTDTIWSFTLSLRSLSMPFSKVARDGTALTASVLIGTAAFILFVMQIGIPFLAQTVVGAAAACSAGAFLWRVALDVDERRGIVAAARRRAVGR